MRKRIPYIVIVIFTSLLLLHGFSVFANEFGRTGATKKSGTEGCGSFAGQACHGGAASPSLAVSIIGPDTLVMGTQAQYSVTISGGPAVEAGTNIAASAGVLAPTDTLLQLFQSELTHRNPVPFEEKGAVTFIFFYTAPALPGTQTLYANGNSVNGNNQPTGDVWNFAPDKQIVVLSSVTNVADASNGENPTAFVLHQNFPNPFNPSTNVRFLVANTSLVRVTVFTLLGEEVETLLHKELEPGTYDVQWNAQHLPSGMYLYRLQAGSFTRTRKMVLAK